MTLTRTNPIKGLGKKLQEAFGGELVEDAIGKILVRNLPKVPDETAELRVEQIVEEHYTSQGWVREGEEVPTYEKQGEEGYRLPVISVFKDNIFVQEELLGVHY